MSTVAAPRIVHHACGHAHRYVLRMSSAEAMAREAARLESERCPPCDRMAFTRPHRARMVDSGLGLLPSDAEYRDHLV
jgi:hypothetical protein